MALQPPAFTHLWAPWRLAYLQADPSGPAQPEDLPFLPEADPNCFICQAAVSPEEQRRLILCRTEHGVALLNRYPYNNGHLLACPKRHAARLDQLTAEEHADLARLVTHLVGRLEKILHPDGFNIGLNLGTAAGAGLPGHLHWHIVPRWHGDTNFMPAIAAVKVIPQALETLWELLTGELAKDRPAAARRE